MVQYISKSALIAKIDDWQDKIKEGIFIIPLEGRQRADAAFEYEILERVRSLLYTLEVKDVDLEKDIDDWYNTMGIPVTTNALKETARHFYELGLKAKKGGS